MNQIISAIFLLVLGSVFLLGGILTYDKSFTLKSNLDQSQDNSILGESASMVNKSSDIIKERAKIAKVLDGDTVETQRGEKIRYIGINAEESGEPNSSESSELNKKLVLGKNIDLEFDIQKKDRYDRTLAYVFVEGLFINLELVKKGMAISQTIQPNIKYQNDFVKAQKEARDKCFGIWKDLCSKNSNNCIKIVSVKADAVGNDNLNKNGEWAEIDNVCSSVISLDRWILKDSSSSNRYQFKNLSVESGKRVLLYSGCGEDSSDKLYWQCPEGKYAIWNNSGDHAFLYNKKGELVSDYQY